VATIFTEHAAQASELLLSGGALEVAADGSERLHAIAPSAQVLLPGAFNPVHEGHWTLAATAQSLLGRPLAFELSLVNVDKPDLPWAEVRRRIEQFHSRGTLWITRAPTFVNKGELFPQSVFVVGADTALRILQPRYYPPGEDSVATALRFMRERGCRFLVGCRVDAGQRVIRLEDLAIPPEFQDLFSEISSQDFRVDVSSTELRANVR
jgi:Cytidylyltransferase-like